MNTYGDTATDEMSAAHSRGGWLGVKQSATRAKCFRSGERGKNRTFNLLTERRVREINGFSDFRAFQVDRLEQF